MITSANNDKAMMIVIRSVFFKLISVSETINANCFPPNNKKMSIENKLK